MRNGAKVSNFSSTYCCVIRGCSGSVMNIKLKLLQFPNVLAYNISKAGVDQLTRCAALELAPKGVRVNCVK